MGKLIFLFIVLALIVFVVYMTWTHIIQPFLHRNDQERFTHAPWEAKEIHRHQTTVIELQKPGCDPMQVGEPVPHHLPFAEYEAKVQDLWIEATELADGKNRRLKA
jgi:hypothetical protein